MSQALMGEFLDPSSWEEVEYGIPSLLGSLRRLLSCPLIKIKLAVINNSHG